MIDPAAAVAAYSTYISDLAALPDCGRPTAIQRQIAFLANQAAETVAMAGTPVDLQFPDFDALDNGVFYPAHNPTFLAAHNANVTALQAALP